MKFYKLDTAISILSITLFMGSLIYAFQSAKIVRENFNFIVASVSSERIEGFLAKEKYHDFGLKKMSDGAIKYSVPLKNTGASPIKISKVYTSCDCAKVILSDNVVHPGKTIVMEVFISISDLGPFGVGVISPSVFLEDDKGGVEKLRFSVLVIP